MDRNNQRKTESGNYGRSRAKTRSQRRALLSRHVLIAVLMMLLAFGMVSISFSYISAQNLIPAQEGSLLLDVRTKTAEQSSLSGKATGEAELSDDITEPEQADIADFEQADIAEGELDRKEDDLALTGADVDVAETGATERYIYCGISNNFDTYKNSSDWGFNFWGGTSAGVKTPTYIANWDHDGRTYHVYRVQVYDDNNKAQFKGNSSWWVPDNGYSVTLNGNTNNAVFFSSSDDGWAGQFQENYQVTSTASLSGSASATTGSSVTLTPSLSSNETYNDILSTTYSVTTNPGSAGFVSSSGVFTAYASGTYTVTATVTYNAKDFTGITKTATATKNITVTGNDIYYLLGFGTGSDYWGTSDNRMVSARKMDYNSSTQKYTFTYYLQEQTYAYGGNDGFKVYGPKNTTWYGHNGNGNNMTRSNSGPWTMGTSTSNGNLGVVADIKGDYIFEFDPSGPNIKIYYPCKLTYNMNGHGTNYTVGVKYNTAATQPSNPSATGYTFGGWYTDSACTTSYNFSTVLTEREKTLYAKWTPNNYTVTLNNGSSASPTSSTKTVTYGAVMPTLSSLPTRTGYNFSGYFTSQNGGGTQYYASDGTAYNNKTWDKASSTTILYAKWTAKTTTVTIYRNYDSSDTTIITTVTATYDSDMPSIASDIPSRTGYTLRGFYTTKTGGNDYDKYYNATGTSSKLWDKEDASYALYAQWDINSYDVTFRGQYRDGSSEYSTTEPSPAPIFKINNETVNSSNSYKQSVAYNSSVALSITPEAYYQFDGIYEGNTKVSANESYNFTLGAANRTFYARYTKKPVVTLSYTHSNPDPSVPALTNASTVVFTASTTGGVSSTYTYQYYYKIGNGNYTLIDDPSSWMPPQAEQYYSFKVVSTSTNGTDTYTGEYVKENVYVEKYRVNYSITTTAADVAGTVTLTQHDTSTGSDVTTTVTNTVLGGTQLNLQIERPATKANYYISSVTVTMGNSPIYSLNDNTQYLNSDFSDRIVISRVTDNVNISYTLSLKPRITLTADANISAYEFKYKSDGSNTTVTAAGSYYVDYGSGPTYKVTPASGYYINSISSNPSVSMSLDPTPPSKTAVTATISNITADTTLTATINSNRGLTVSIVDKPAGCGDGTLTISSESKSFDTKYSYDYNDPQTVVITPPSGYYVSEVTVSPANTDHDQLPSLNNGSYTITNLRIKNDDVTVNVKYAANPVINVQQPQYGSVWLTSGSGNNLRYYFNGDSVEYNTALQVHAVVDTTTSVYNQSYPVMTLSSITANGTAIQSSGSNLLPASGADYIDYTVQGDTVFSANITYAFESAAMPAITKANYRRIFFTDNLDWGTSAHDQLFVHYSNDDTDYAVAAPNSNPEGDPIDVHNVQMTYLYTNEDSAGVYYADIPSTFDYVMFHTGYDPEGDTEPPTYKASVYSEYKALTTSNNAYSSDSTATSTNPKDMSNDWMFHYADYRTVGSAGDHTLYNAQQKSVGKNSSAVFSYDCDNVNALTITKISGCTCSFSYGNGKLRITPTPEEDEPNYAFVQVTSNYTGMVKYYLVKVSLFELKSFESLQKLFNPEVFGGESPIATTIALKVISKGFGAGDPDVDFEYSLNNVDYNAISGTVTHTSTTIDEISGFILSRLDVPYSTYNFQGVNYFRTTVSDGESSDSRDQKTVFGLSQSEGDSVIYFRTTRVNLASYQLVARFTIADNNVWTTMTPVSSSGSLYRVAVPAAATKVRFYLMYPDKYSSEITSIDDTYDGQHIYYYSSSSSVDIVDNQVFEVSAIDEYEISGAFAPFSN